MGSWYGVGGVEVVFVVIPFKPMEEGFEKN